MIVDGDLRASRLNSQHPPTSSFICGTSLATLQNFNVFIVLSLSLDMDNRISPTGQLYLFSYFG
jgi:hypothetical protein